MRLTYFPPLPKITPKRLQHSYDPLTLNTLVHRSSSLEQLCLHEHQRNGCTSFLKYSLVIRKRFFHHFRVQSRPTIIMRATDFPLSYIMSSNILQQTKLNMKKLQRSYLMQIEDRSSIFHLTMKLSYYKITKNIPIFQ